MHPAQATLAGLCAIGIALGMSRFAYTPLVPALIRDDWTTIPQAGFLGGANCFGYLVSCVIAITLPRILGVRQVMRIGLGAGLLGVLLSSFNFGFAWLVIARFIAGLAAAPLVVLTPSVLSTHMPERWRKLSAGLAFSGAGLFTLLVSLTLPFVLHQNVQVGWFYETAVVAVAVLLTWPLTSRASNKPLDTSRSSGTPQWSSTQGDLGSWPGLRLRSDRHATADPVPHRLLASRSWRTNRHSQSAVQCHWPGVCHRCWLHWCFGQPHGQPHQPAADLCRRDSWGVDGVHQPSALADHHRGRTVRLFCTRNGRHHLATCDGNGGNSPAPTHLGNTEPCLRHRSDCGQQRHVLPAQAGAELHPAVRDCRHRLGDRCDRHRPALLQNIAI